MEGPEGSDIVNVIGFGSVVLCRGSTPSQKQQVIHKTVIDGTTVDLPTGRR
jgi:hypothetical protein